MQGMGGREAEVIRSSMNELSLALLYPKTLPDQAAQSLPVKQLSFCYPFTLHLKQQFCLLLAKGLS